MKMPIQDRRALIRKHNIEQEELNRELEGGSNGNIRTFEGESINTYAKLEQSNRKGG